MRIALAQMNPLVGDIEGNAETIVRFASEARDAHRAHVVAFPELSLTGYPPEDLLLRPELYVRVERALARIVDAVHGVAIIVGLPSRAGERRYNSAVVVDNGALRARYHKQILPNYGVFDEKRYFHAGDAACVVDIDGVAVGITLCEDIWEAGPAERAAAAGARVLVNLNASPFHVGKYRERERVLRERVHASGLPIVYVNQVGGQDELVFDGESLAMDARGEIVLRAPAFAEGIVDVSYAAQAGGFEPAGEVRANLDETQAIYGALTLAVRDYIGKNGFDGALVGLSGGIDSALTLALAVDALGADRVEALSMPSRYTAAVSLEGARAVAESLDVRYHEIGIEGPFQAFLDALAEPFAGLPTDITEENIQARIRGVLLMAFSNKHRRIVLATGNKSEMAVGYATLYGDMAGGFAPLKDVSKARVYALSRYRNRLHPVIPQGIIERAPSAELAPEQKDEDSLPAYSVLDPILERYVERDWAIDQIVAEGFDEAIVRRVAGLVLGNEYKRRQAPPGARITTRAFGKERRFPITSGYGRDIGT